MLVYEMETLCKWYVIDFAITHIRHLSDCIALNSLTILICACSVTLVKLIIICHPISVVAPFPKKIHALILKYVQNVYGLSSKPDIAFDLIIISTDIQEASWKYSWGVIL